MDGLRAVAVTGVNPGALATEFEAEPWRARLLRRSPRLLSPAESIAELETELRAAMKSDAPGALVRESAIRATLAHAIVQDAEARRLTGPDWTGSLRTALGILDDSCQIPEAMLNAAAIHIELARCERVAAVRQGASPDADRRAAAVEHIRIASAVLKRMAFADASTCDESRDGFFGLRGDGKRLCYVLDKSASMNVPGGFDELLKEIEKTLASLPDDISFSVLFFSDPVRDQSGQVVNANYSEIVVEPRYDDGSGMFSRALLGDRVDSGGLGAVLSAIKAVIPDGNTEPSSALRRALMLGPSDIFLLTDGVIETSDEVLLEIADEARTKSCEINTILFMSVHAALPAGIPPALAEASVEKLRFLSQRTGGAIRIATQSDATGTAGIENPGDDTAGTARAALSSTVTVRSETILDRMKRRGYWTPESDRQFHAIAAELLALDAHFTEAQRASSAALGVVGVDIVTALDPLAVPAADWPRIERGDATHAVPMDPTLIYENAMLAALSGDRELASGRFDAAARVWAKCARSAEDSGRSDDAADFCDLACRALLMDAFCRPPAAGMDPRSSAAAAQSLSRAAELGVARSSGWNRLLLAAAAGGLSDMKLGVQNWLAGDDAPRAAEVRLVRSYFRRDGLPPSEAEFEVFPHVEGILFGQIAESIRASEAP